MKKQDRDYKLLEYLNVRPRISYQARLRNPNAAVPGAVHVGMTLLDNPENNPLDSVKGETEAQPNGEKHAP